tara:strand:- start:3112 stop:3396 length:285 start_codon:yes stop_codon:yes gene_type:complete
MRRYDKQYWDKFTHNDWRIPFNYKEKEKSLNAGIKDRGISLRKCKSCNKVYEREQAFHKKKFIRVWYYSCVPKNQKRLDICPICNGEKAQIVEM